MRLVLDENGLSEIIGFILILGLVVAAFSLWMTYVVPIDGREQEIAQMNLVKDRFTDYKFSLDSLWVNNENLVTLSTSLNLGTGGGNTEAGGFFLPMLKPIASSAVIGVKDTGDIMWINSSDSSDYRINMSLLEYQSSNNYWIQQRYYYQTGGVFLSQTDGSTCRISPAFTFVKANNGTSDVAVVTMVPIQVLGGSSIGGNGPVRIDTWMKTPTELAFDQQVNWVSISVNVADNTTAQMWASLLNETLARGGISDTSWYTVSPVVEDPITHRGSVSLTINGPPASSGAVILYLTRVDYVVNLNNIASGLT